MRWVMKKLVSGLHKLEEYSLILCLTVMGIILFVPVSYTHLDCEEMAEDDSVFLKYDYVVLVRLAVDG